MTKPKLTPWFKPGTKPAHVGVYETKIGRSDQIFQNWNGSFWGCCTRNPALAAEYSAIESGSQQHRWRGLAKEPK